MSGQLQEGDQLPSVRDLAGKLKVNPMTVSKSYSLLELEEIVERKRGKGLFVAALSHDLKAKKKLTMLEQSMQSVAAQAVQMDISFAEASTLFKKLYYRNKPGK